MSENPETEKQSLSEIAKEQFGEGFVGEVIPDNEAGAETVDITQSSEPTEIVSEEPDSEEPEGIEAAEDTEQEEDDSTETEEPTLTIKVDGLESEVPQSEIIKSYQINKASEKNLTEAKAKADEILANATSERQSLNESMAVAAQLLNSDFETLAAEKAKVDWDALEVDDPATFAAKRLKFDDKENQIRGRIEAARMKFREAELKQADDNKTNLGDVIRAEQIQLIEKIPEWKNPKTAEAEGGEVVEYLIKEGVPRADVDNLNSHVGFVIARKAMLWDKQHSASNPAAKKIKSVPKTIKPGAAKQASAGTSKQLREAQATAKASGSIDDAHKVLELQRKIA